MHGRVRQQNFSKGHTTVPEEELKCSRVKLANDFQENANKQAQEVIRAIQ